MMTDINSMEMNYIYLTSVAFMSYTNHGSHDPHDAAGFKSYTKE